MQVNQNIRLNELHVNDLEEPLVEPEFVIRQVDLGKQQAFGKQIIGDGDALEHVFLLHQVLQLLVPFGHEKKFQRESKLLRIFVKLGQERVVRKCFQDQSCIKMLGKQVCQRCFPG